MCSVSWLPHDTGYDLFFNRDEQRTRPTAELPSLQTEASTKYLSPKDPQGGGTWIFVNKHGLTTCLLNAYQQETSEPPQNPTSRGLLVKSLASCQRRQDLEAKLQQLLQTHTYSPFYLLALDAHQQVSFWLWNSRNLQSIQAPALPFFTTSSQHPETVLNFRKNTATVAIEQNGLNPETLKNLHMATGIPASEKTIKMSRQDARTVSFTQITVQPNLATMHYAEREEDLDFQKTTTTRLPLS